MQVFHNIRLLVLILGLVVADGAVFQSTLYLVSAAVGLAWDLAHFPYNGVLLTGAALTMDADKAAAAAGYLWLAIHARAGQMGDRIFAFEIAMLAGVIGTGMIMAIAQQVAGGVDRIREGIEKRDQLEQEQRQVCVADQMGKVKVLRKGRVLRVN